MIKDRKRKNIMTSILSILIYLILPYFFYEILNIFKISNILNLTVSNLITLIILLYLYKKEIVTSFSEFKNNIVKYTKKYIKYWIIMLILMLISNFIISIFTNSSTSLNEKIIIEQLKISPICIFIITILISPIMEELIFRLSLSKIISNNILYIIISSLAFGFAHILGESSTNLLYLIPYTIPGIILSYVYIKSKNICVSMYLHMIHNLFMIILELILISL